MLPTNSDTFSRLIFSALCFDYVIVFVSSVGQTWKDKVHLLNEDVLEPQYRETDKLLSVRNYALEDFFWTGSGDGPPPPDPHSSWMTSQLATTTLLATIFIESPPDSKPPSSEEEDCVSECPISPYDGSAISPTRPGHGKPSKPPPDQKYWLLTVLQAPVVHLPQNLDMRLAKLYKTAFLRQQEEHLGIITTSSSLLRNKQIKSTTKELKNPSNNGSKATNNSKSQTNPSTLPSYGIDDFKMMKDSPDLESNFTNDDDSEAAFEYITNYFEITTTDLPKRVSKRSVNQEINNNTLDVVKRQISDSSNQPDVEVFLYNVTTVGDTKELKVIYWVSVGGHPVPALTAARDMKLLADSEVVAELGYPFTTKAEPYLKFPEPVNGMSRASNVQDTWLIVGATILAIIFLMVMIAFLIFRLAYKRKSSADTTAIKERTNIDNSKGVQYPSNGKDNMAYIQEDGKLISVVSPSKKMTNEQKQTHHGSPPRRYIRGPHYKMNRVGSADSTSSTSSSSDLSQANATLRQRQKLFAQQLHSEYATINKKNKSKHRRMRSKKGVIYTPRAGSPVEIKGDGTLQRFLVSDPPSPVASSSELSICGEDIAIRRPTVPVSPTSYLSMPSVKSFPRSNAVEPLSKVLEPLSVRHLDMDSPVHHYGTIKQQKNEKEATDGDLKTSKNEEKKQTQPSFPQKSSPCLVRLGSMDKDPGVIGPMVWDLHNQRLKDSKMLEELNSGGNISRMRQRYSELVDDAFSLFGSGSQTPKSLTTDLPRNKKQPERETIRQKSEEYPTKPSELVKVHTGLDQRPLTALPPRPPLPKQGSAWGRLPSSNMSRSTSAGSMTRRPVVDTVRVNSEGILGAGDPALPLLQAIRNELNKLPGTSDA